LILKQILKAAIEIDMRNTTGSDANETVLRNTKASSKMRERNYYAAMMVNLGDADALVSGYSRSYPTVF
jgi:phosphotransacetylase